MKEWELFEEQWQGSRERWGFSKPLFEAGDGKLEAVGVAGCFYLGERGVLSGSCYLGHHRCYSGVGGKSFYFSREGDGEGRKALHTVLVSLTLGVS